MAAARASELVDATHGRRESRRRAILDAAEHLFTQHGVAKVTLGAIVARSGGSLSTVYDMFGNKDGLLRAVLERHRREHFADWLDGISADDRPSTALRIIAERYYSYVTSPGAIAMARIVIGHSIDDRDAGPALYHDHTADDGPWNDLVALFRAWAEQGRMAVDDAEAAVSLFSAMVACDAYFPALMGVAIGEHPCGTLEWRVDAFIGHFRVE